MQKFCFWVYWTENKLPGEAKAFQILWNCFIIPLSPTLASSHFSSFCVFLIFFLEEKG